jgi:Leucyl-tRNA synthetase, editing domain
LATGRRPTPNGRAWADLSPAEQQAVIDGRRLAYRADGPPPPRPTGERQESRAKTGVVTGAVATNPATGASIPMFVADYVLMGYGTGAVMGVPGQDQRDWEFAEAFDVPIVRTVQPPEGFEGRGLDLLRLGSFIFRDRVRTGALGTYPVMSDRGLHS